MCSLHISPCNKPPWLSRMQACYVTILLLSYTLHLRSDAAMQWCLQWRWPLYRIMRPLALCWMMNCLSIMQVTAPLMGLSFYLHSHELLLVDLLYSWFIYMVIFIVITGMISFMSLCTLRSWYCSFMCQNICLLLSFSAIQRSACSPRADELRVCVQTPTADSSPSLLTISMRC